MRKAIVGIHLLAITMASIGLTPVLLPEINVRGAILGVLIILFNVYQIFQHVKETND